ncbi:MAG: heavy-metal-associated domain-containing protein [Candidatus Eiseniibacteriota bacterium]
MKRELALGMSVAIALVLGVCFAPAAWRGARALPRVFSALSARADQRVVTLEVAGMTCANCADRVAGEIERVPGVSTADVRLAERRVIVVCRKSVADSLLAEAVSRAGPGYRAFAAAR